MNVLQFCSTIRNNIWPEGGEVGFTYFEFLFIMERLSLEQLKAKKSGQAKENLEAIKGGQMDACHAWDFIMGCLDRLTFWNA